MPVLDIEALTAFVAVSGRPFVQWWYDQGGSPR